MTQQPLYFGTGCVNRLRILAERKDRSQRIPQLLPLTQDWKQREIQTSLMALLAQEKSGSVQSETNPQESPEDLQTLSVEGNVQEQPNTELPTKSSTVYQQHIQELPPPTLADAMDFFEHKGQSQETARDLSALLLETTYLSAQHVSPPNRRNNCFLATCHIKSNHPQNNFYLELSKDYTFSAQSSQFSTLSMKLFYNELSMQTLKCLLMAFVHADVIFWEVPNRDLLSQLRMLKIVKSLRETYGDSLGGNSSRGAPTLTFLWKVSVMEMEQLRKVHGSRVLSHLESLRLELESNVRIILKRSIVAAGSGVNNPLCSLDPKKCVLVQHAKGKGVDLSSKQSDTFDPFQLWNVKKTIKIPKTDPDVSTSRHTSKPTSHDELTRHLRKQYEFRSTLGHGKSRQTSNLITNVKAWIRELLQTEDLLLSKDFNRQHRKKIIDCIDPNFSFSLQRSQQAYDLVFHHFQKKGEMKKYRNKKNYIQSIVVMFARYACGECMDIFMSALVERLSSRYTSYAATIEEKQREFSQKLPRPHQAISYNLIVSERTDRERFKGRDNVPDYGCPITRVTFTSHGSASNYDATNGIGALVELKPESRIHTTKLKWFEQSWPTHSRGSKKTKHRCYIGLLYHNVINDDFFIMTPKILHSVKFESDDEESQNQNADILMRTDVPLFTRWPKQLTKKKEKHINQMTRLERIFVVTPKVQQGCYIFSPKFAVFFQDEHVVYDLEESITLASNSLLEIRLEHNEAYSSLNFSSVQMLHAKLQRNYLVPSYE
eukprot:CAMPEP_0117437052 /NCGR_PEP_ID=MMETSP0759-20121206/1323_1 /TAXON_ID=63605 /ORGANISM="Percolomonas cosmopolitus, Strain WS" /LENGTH=771 /DNA_ID=CAMNT_0005228669 /DNA_START=69 /DNA_END=2384 /DNA_ORIENTATION=+